MTRWARVNDLFHAARARPLSDRDAFLALECGGDGVLRAEVESLLAAHDVNPASVTSSGVTVGSRVGDYEITGFLAAGAMGEVYRARDSKLGRDVALKILPAAFMADSDRCARFEREARALAALNHPNIATIYGFVESTSAASGQSVSALALELVEGETLADRIARGRLPVDAALRIARQIAEALEAAHEQGIIHRDLKPANIKLTRDGVVKVLDFGLAKLSSPDDTTTATSPSVTGAGVKTGAGVLLGTPAYMSPEQARGETVDKRTDIWAFGCVLFELLTGRAVFEGQGVSDTLATVLKTEPDWKTLPTDVPRLITALIESCLQKDRSRRLRDMAAARFALESQAVGRPAGDSTPVASKAWRRVITAAATAVVVWALVFMTARSTSPVALSPVSTFRVALGEGQRFTNLGRLVIAISPDGSRIVYVANDRLYTRRMSELDATPIAGTEGFGMVTSPAFSPDGTSVVFYAEGSLKRITVTGGRAVTIAPASNPHGVSWEGETILFGQQGTGIVAVPAHGGQPEVEVKASPEETADSPQLLPGVNAILFSVTKAAGINRWDEADIVVYSRDSQQRKVVIRGGSAARYVPSGHILYAVQDSLMAVPFDLERLDVTGSPVPVLEKVLRSGAGFTDTAQLDVSGNGTLTYIPAAAVLRRTLVWVDRQGREELVKSEPREFGDAQLSPDGQRVAIQIDNDVWTFDLARGVLTRLTFEAEEDETPMWAPDGSWIAYASTDGGRPTVFRRRADGTGPRERVWSAPEPQMHTHVSDWTPNGRTLVISHDAPLGSDGTQVSLIEFDDDRTTTSLLRSRFNNNTGRVSPDGRWIAYRSDESGRYEVYVQPFPSLEGKWQISTGGGQQPLWSAKGDELFYRGEGAVMAVRVSSGASFSAGPPQKLFDDHYVAARGADRVHYDVSSDGRRFLMVKEDASFPQASVAPHFVVVENWFQELKRLVPTN